jgi:hypothetical protein
MEMIFFFLHMFNHIINLHGCFCAGASLAEGCSSSSSDSHGAKEKVSEDVVICHSNLVSHGAVENSDGSKIRLLNVIRFDPLEMTLLISLFTSLNFFHQDYPGRLYPSIVQSVDENDLEKQGRYVLLIASAE